MLTRSTASKEWNDFTSSERKAIVAVGAAQFLLIGAALWDLRRRPAHEVRGSKRLWTPAVFVNFVGPVLYFFVGRKR